MRNQDQIATYFVNGVDRNADDLRLLLHTNGCRYLNAASTRPHVGQRTANKADKVVRKSCTKCR